MSAARERIELVHPVGYDYFDTLRSKLLWGRDTRDRDHKVVRTGDKG